MKLPEDEYRPLARDLSTVRRHGNVLGPLLGEAFWEDEEVGGVYLVWWKHKVRKNIGSLSLVLPFAARRSYNVIMGDAFDGTLALYDVNYRNQHDVTVHYGLESQMPAGAEGIAGPDMNPERTSLNDLVSPGALDLLKDVVGRQAQLVRIEDSGLRVRQPGQSFGREWC